MTISKHVLNAITKKLQKAAKEDSGYDVDIEFKDPVSFKIKDGAVRLHLNVTASVDANLLLKLIEKGLGSED